MRKLNPTRITLLAFIFAVVPGFAFAQGSFMRSYAKYKSMKENGQSVKSYQRYDIGFSFAFASADYKDHYTTVDMNGDLFDTTLRRKLVAKPVYGLSFSTYFPVAGMGENSILAIAVGVRGNVYKWNTGNVVLGPNYTYNYDYLTMDMGVPISVDMKWGCDAMLDKSTRTCFTIGIGGQPTYLMTGTPTGINTDGSVSLAGSNVFKVQPFIKAEAGFFAGICFKVRAMYNFANIKYLDMSGDNEQISLQGTSNFNLSIVLMPFSWDWGKEQWWNKR
ncbi:MAG: hypothetical protein JSS96_09630 [Bacteroidetes bacterium]|nr:hypothetical protein [Bacteroidota bacterium]